MRCILMLSLFASVAVCVPGRAEVESGPRSKEPMPLLTVAMVAGPGEGKDVDIKADRGEKPTVVLFVHAEKFSRPMARFLRDLDTKLPAIHDDAAAVAVWVGGDQDKNKAYLPKAQASLKFARTSLAACPTATPDGWGLNTDAHLTAIVVVKGKIVKSWGFVSINETDTKPVIDALTAAVKP